MRTFYKAQLYEVYGEPTPQMVREFLESGLGIMEDYTGEVSGLMRANGQEAPQLPVFVGGTALALSQEA